MVTDVYHFAAWKRVRAVVLERDGGRCQIRGESCTGTATQVDHIVEVSRGGEWYALDNLRAACEPCNKGRNKALMAERAKVRPSREW
jgi:5-methylcytosine-specific restriction protein A